MNDQQARRINEAAQKFAEALVESYRTATEHAVSAQQLTAKLTQDFFSAVIDNLREQAEGNKALTQGLVDLQRRQMEAAQVLGQESASAYEGFLDSLFFHYGRN
jgi:ABC-type nitrate/sulfonate/bicarbonate transport system substrate-binding protein